MMAVELMIENVVFHVEPPGISLSRDLADTPAWNPEQQEFPGALEHPLCTVLELLSQRNSELQPGSRWGLGRTSSEWGHPKLFFLALRVPTAALIAADTGTVKPAKKLDPLFWLHGLKYEQCAGSVAFFFLVEPRIISFPKYDNIKHLTTLSV